MRTLVFLLALGLGSAASAQELGRFTCERPKPWEAGALRNVSVAASLVDSVVLAPGGDFSFNRTMRAGDGRFVRGTSFLGGREIKSVGGGICQVSSGLYNAALLAGLPILERSSHSLYDPREAYVAPGRDAMVSRESNSDFRFRNSTASNLTIVAMVRGGRLTIVLLGTPPGSMPPRRRWILATVLRRSPAGVKEILSASLAPGQCRRLSAGFDGMTVASRLCWAGTGPDTHCADLGVDHYEKVDEVWLVGAPARDP